MISLAQAQANVRAALRDAGIDSAEIDARLLLSAAADLDRASILSAPETLLTQAQETRLADMTRRRAAHEPMAYILGAREFRSMEFLTPPGVLIPRPDTETLVEAALEAAPHARSIVDLGVGTGCILLSLLAAMPEADGWGVDLNPAALEASARNAHKLGLAQRAHFVASDWGGALERRFDLLVSNPPYIATSEVETLAPDVRAYEPRLALDGGEDGLSAYRILAPQAVRLLNPGGVAAFEIGWDQSAAVARLLTEAGLREVQTRQDMAGRDRVVLGKVQ